MDGESPACEREKVRSEKGNLTQDVREVYNTTKECVMCMHDHR